MSDLSYDQADTVVSITDATGASLAAVKAASTAAIATDPSLVVALSPNSSLPAGANALGTVFAKLEDGVGTAIASSGILGNQRLLVSATTHETESSIANKLYTFSIDVNLPTNGTESVLILFKNPNASGKTFSIRRIIFDTNGTTAVTGVMRMYANPTSSANGVAITVSSTNIGGGAGAAAATPFTGPTVSANGTRFFSGTVGQGANQGPLEYDFNGVQSLAANNNILITGQPSANNLSVGITFVWGEF